jgi:hypothetical protein
MSATVTGSVYFISLDIQRMFSRCDATYGSLAQFTHASLAPAYGARADTPALLAYKCPIRQADNAQ